jgi:hypothetical protein
MPPLEDRKKERKKERMINNFRMSFDTLPMWAREETALFHQRVSRIAKRGAGTRFVGEFVNEYYNRARSALKNNTPGSEFMWVGCFTHNFMNAYDASPRWYYSADGDTYTIEVTPPVTLCLYEMFVWRCLANGQWAFCLRSRMPLANNVKRSCPPPQDDYEVMLESRFGDRFVVPDGHISDPVLPTLEQVKREQEAINGMRAL